MSSKKRDIKSFFTVIPLDKKQTLAAVAATGLGKRKADEERPTNLQLDDGALAPIEITDRANPDIVVIASDDEQVGLAARCDSI